MCAFGGIDKTIIIVDHSYIHTNPHTCSKVNLVFSYSLRVYNPGEQLVAQQISLKSVRAWLNSIREKMISTLAFPCPVSLHFGRKTVFTLKSDLVKLDSKPDHS